MNKKIFVIAEMANSHEGSLSVAKKIVKCAAKSGADAIKFQKFFADELAESSHENYPLYKNLEMNENEWAELVNFAKKNNLGVFVDVFGVKSAKRISKLNIDGYKIHSSDLANPFLLKFLSNENKPVLLSMGGSLLTEIDTAIDILQKVSKEIVLMHSFQGYPTNLSDLNLSRIPNLKKRYDYPIGIMDHVSGDSDMAIIVPLLAVSLGATIIEKHLTLDRSKKGLDYYSALNPDEFAKLVSLLKNTKTSLGSSDFFLSKNELNYRLLHKKNSISNQLIKKGTKLDEKMFEYKRTKIKTNSIPFYDFKEKTCSKTIPKGTILTKNFLNSKPKIAAVIACRIHSARLFAKQLQLVGDIPILQLVLNQLDKSTLIDEIILGISEKAGNDVFIDFAKQHKLKFIVGDDRDVLKRLIDGAKFVDADIVFRITPENPYIYWEGIDTLIKKHIDGNFDFSYVFDLPLGSGFEVINLKALEISHKKGMKKHRSELCSLYINEHKNKFNIFQFFPPKQLQRPELRLTVDTPQDLFLARKIYESIGKNGVPIPLKDVINFLDKNPELIKINSNVPIGVSRIWNIT